MAKKELQQFIQYLHSRRDTILNKWRTICIDTQSLISKTGFSREEFNDQAPVLLNILAQRLAGEPDESSMIDRAKEHGLHRWQRGYSLPELLTELETLYWVILDEVQLFQQTYHNLDMESLSKVHRQVFKIFGETSRGSVLYYDQLRQTNAAEQANTMQHALQKLEQLSKDRSEHLMQSSHDLRSGFSLMLGAVHLLQLPNTKEEIAEMVDMLNRNLTSVREMLLQLTDYARIEAGQEKLDIKKFDVAKMLQQVIESAQPIAKLQNLVLTGEGPQPLMVKSDTVKIQRIVQNLLYNALKYTKKGGIYISWAQENESRWLLSVQDTGPGFIPQSPASLLAEQLKPLGQPSSAHQSLGTSEYPAEGPPSTEQLKKPSTAQMKESEGIGLFIVKKLCELLRASMDIETGPGSGTLIRIRFVSQ